MTKQEIHRRALLTAAKLSLFAAGCGGVDGDGAHTQATTASTTGATGVGTPTATVAAPTSAPPPPKTPSPSTTVSAGPPADAPSKDKGCPLPVYSLPTDADVSCCEAEVAAAFPAGGGAGADPSPGVAACCGVAIDYYDHHGAEAAAAGHVLPWNVLSACCGALHPAPIGPTCTPWGPPPPPAMPIGWA